MAALSGVSDKIGMVRAKMSQQSIYFVQLLLQVNNFAFTYIAFTAIKMKTKKGLRDEKLLPLMIAAAVTFAMAQSGQQIFWFVGHLSPQESSTIRRAGN